MMAYHVAPLQRLVEQFERLPGIGSKTAQRLAYFVLNMPEERAKEFSDAILQAHKTIRRCEICCNFSDQERCPICRNDARDKSVICVVETPRDAIAIEGTGE
ncbi:MAG TPA: recombination protein RecR, partial [Ruminococcaceae bacterium]|nr:recombination protein RecR [Oscillospiraceae bacterium]